MTARLNRANKSVGLDRAIIADAPPRVEAVAAIENVHDLIIGVPDSLATPSDKHA